MPGWDDILGEVNSVKSSLDIVRHKYLERLHSITGRNVVAYYSGWLKKPGMPFSDINDSDMTGFMNAVKGLDCSKGLDLILHTPGGSPAATEAIVNYLRIKFNNDIRVIVPQLAMSAGTMLACSAKSIVMGKQSSLGPIDPQFNGIPAYNIKEEFEEAKKDLANNQSNFAYWKLKLEKYPAAFLKTALDAIELSDELLKNWLGTCMFDSKKDASKIKAICQELNEHSNSKSHGRHIGVQRCAEIGLKIELMEDTPELQDAILSLHHAYCITLDATDSIKIIENHNGMAMVSHTRK